MKSLQEFFQGNSSLNILFFLLSVISIILAFIFYYKSLKDKRPVYTKKTFRLVNDSLSTIKNIEIKYNHVIVKNLSLTKIAIWNAGKESIKKSDITTIDPLVIFASDDTIIYDFEIIHSNEVNNFIVTKKNEKSINISFDFLDLNDGIILNVYQSGKNSDDVVVKGTLIGARKISQGVRKGYFMQKADYITLPFRYLIYHKNIFAQILGYILIIPVAIFLYIPSSFIMLPLDGINDIIANRMPAEFNFNEE